MIVIAIVAFHVVFVSLGLVVGSRALPPQLIGDMVGYLHKAIGITAPTPGQLRTAALIWIGAAIVAVDGIVLFLIFITSISLAR